jgi:hypothetical protein
MEMAEKPATGGASIWKNSMARIRDRVCKGDGIRAGILYRDMHGNGIPVREHEAEPDLLRWALLQNIRKTNGWIRRLVEMHHNGPKPGSMRGLPF